MVVTQRINKTAAALLIGFLLYLSDASHARANAFLDPAATGTVGFANLQAVEKEIKAGVSTIGSTSYVVALFKNNGVKPVTVDSLNLYPSSNISAEVSLNQCSIEPLEPNAQCAITLAISPLKVGEWRMEILVNHSGQSRLAIASLIGQVTRSEQETTDLQLDILVLPEMLDFGKLEENVPLTRSITFRNTTSRLIDIYRLEVEAPKQAGFEMVSDCAELASGQTCVATIKWKPQVRGTSQGVLVLEHSGPSRINRVEVKGEYLPRNQAALKTWPEAIPGRGLLIADRTEINFGNTVAGPSAITISLANAGDVPIKLDAISLVGSSNGLSLARTGCYGGLSLEQGDACPITINWQPLRVGAILDDLVIRHDGVRGVLVLPVRGAATAEGVTNSQAAIRTTALQGGVTNLSGAGSSSATSASIDLDALTASPSSGDSGGTASNSAATGAISTTVEGDAEPEEVKRTLLSLDGFAISSLSKQKAVIRGPNGSLVVRDGQERVLLAGLSWNVSIVSYGVRLYTANEEAIIFFDPFLRPSPSVASSVGASNFDRSPSTPSSSGQPSTSVPEAAAPQASVPSDSSFLGAIDNGG